MLATIILDSFTSAKAADIASALGTICSPDDTYGFASVGLYCFWSLPERDILYVGLSDDLRRRFRQHTGLVKCEPKGCKRREIEAYFQHRPRLGFTVVVQSPRVQPLTAGDLKALAEEYGELGADLFEGMENAAVGEAFLIQLHESLGERLPVWNKQHGVERGRRRRSFSTTWGDRLRSMVEIIRTGRISDNAERDPLPYELLLNLTGEELSALNARATLREIADDATICEDEAFLHGVRMRVVELRFPKDRGHEVSGVDSGQGVHRCLARGRRTRPSSSSPRSGW